ncbi:cytochrome-c oxidase, cbb3-type subunit III [Helicobacter sp. 12S02634-8]|uniref:cytochrome-c oxidase, cbb3-type subunit III n=1 Tax=Helicobacter sp. 12S02634-8 TaxID=1476199 RepID=UPI000BA7D6A6|nr:cytochrome-c oxidase, cbb3-type subunit III [Helicobacter sp. 12S02634-8]PAF46379.1 cytochrome-c oxidase, cbb3-type subunit III [Helicobacter sp. 12S02634-8]
MGWLSDNINLIGLLAAIGILALTIITAGALIKKMREAKPSGDLTDHNWDGISEFNNNIPVGWVLTFMVLVVWLFWYVFFAYPLDAYSQIGEYNQEVQTHNEKFEQKWANLSHEDMVNMGQGIFLVQCSQCHGITAEGMHGKAQNLTRWGKEEGIIDTIEHGSVGLGYDGGEMPVLGLSKEDAKAVASYIMADISEVKHTQYPDEVQKGKAVYDTAGCAGCHGPDGKGMPGMDNFAPDLSKYGTEDFLKRVLAHGKKGLIGQMPSFAYRNFNDVQIKALAEYINSLMPLGEE